MSNVIDFSIQWHITERCPNRCKHCYMYDQQYENKLHEELSLNNLLESLENIEKFEKKYDVCIPNYIITGGDPFARNDAFDFLSVLNAKKKNLIILGIPEQVTLSNIRRMYEHGVKMYQVSLDGTKQNHDRIRGKGSFDKTIAALRLLNRSPIRSAVMFTLTPDNADDMFPLIDYLDEIGIKSHFAFDFVVYEGNATEYDTKYITSDFAENLFKTYLRKKEELIRRDSQISLINKVKLLNVLENEFIEKDIQEFEKFSSCGGCYNGFSSISIDANGEVYPCRRLPISVGNITRDSFEDILINNPLLKQFRRRASYVECGSCKYFKVCRGCPAYSYSVYRDPFRKPTYCFLKEVNENIINIEQDEDEMQLIRNTQRNKELQDYMKQLIYAKNHQNFSVFRN